MDKCKVEKKDIYKQIFDIVGGVPRVIFNDTVDSATEYIQEAVSSCNLEKLSVDISTRVFTENASSALLQPIVNSSTLKMEKIEFVSNHAFELFFETRINAFLNPGILQLLLAKAGK
jgi:hypothetical protein